MEGAPWPSTLHTEGDGTGPSLPQYPPLLFTLKLHVSPFCLRDKARSSVVCVSNSKE